SPHSQGNSIWIRDGAKTKKGRLWRPLKFDVPHPALISGTRNGLALEGARQYSQIHNKEL
ncbi:hypothetical protein ACOZB2_31050, partial [Pantoea endophytica]